MKTIVPLKLNRIDEVAMVLQNLNKPVDLIEIWIDGLIDDLLKNKEKVADLRLLIAQVKQEHNVQLLAVCKGPAEQGVFNGTPMQKWQLLQYFLEFGGDYIDLDVTQNPVTLIEALDKTKLWCSFHDFEKVSEEILDEILATMLQLDPFLYKFAVTVQTQEDLDTFINWCEKSKSDHPDKKFIFTTMGELGTEGRDMLETKELTWGGFWALSEELKTASGQRVLK